MKKTGLSAAILLTAALLGEAAAAPPARADDARTADEGCRGQPPVVTYGDSLADGMGRNLKDRFACTANLGIIGAGILAERKIAPLDQIPPGAVVLVSIGTNDVGWLLDADKAAIDDYARRLADVMLDIRARGGRPVLIGMQAPLRPYDPKGDGHPWSDATFARWKIVMAQVDKAIRAQARADGFKYVSAKGIGDRAPDGLHYTDAGYDEMAAWALHKLHMKLPPPAP